MKSVYAGNAEAHQVALYVHDKCPFPIWPTTAPNNGQPVIEDGGFYLAPGQTERVITPWTWNGRIWARTGCNIDSNWKPACETGDCDGRLACNGLIGTPSATLYDVSLVEGYNIPVSVTPKITNPKCLIQGCLKDVRALCPPEVEVLNSKGEVVGYKSACLAFDDDRFCCRNEYGSPGKCKPNVNAFDSPTPLVSCASSGYVITFCPYGWGGAGEHKSE
ncbi:hypothetical protein V8G54_006856 [Vigna mungo]|uniref:Thaumatin-like protein n=1 Tax=Vigna mungo TaxID=3915 RepID=A0AAQ3S8H4_VIGMU